jgi:hypothetical protein
MPDPSSNSQHALEHWSIGVYQGKGLDSLEPRSGPCPVLTGKDFRQWRGIGLADPFAVHREDAWYLFFELFLKGEHHAVIGAARSTDLGHWDPLGIVHSQPHHLSYPFLFEHDGHVYMMPESKAVRRVDIFRAEEFPHRWVFVKTILRGRLMDCSMVHYKQRYWLFAGWRSYWLRLFHAPHPLGPWRSHWLPFIRSYSRSATRPGGKPIVWDGQLIRFSQDNVHYYGEQLRAWRVTRLNRLWYSETAYSDKPILKGAGVGWNASCMHHIDAHLTDAPGSQSRLLAFVDGCV